MNRLILLWFKIVWIDRWINRLFFSLLFFAVHYLLKRWKLFRLFIWLWSYIWRLIILRTRLNIWKALIRIYIIFWISITISFVITLLISTLIKPLASLTKSLTLTSLVKPLASLPKSLASLTKSLSSLTETSLTSSRATWVITIIKVMFNILSYFLFHL